MRIYNRFSCGRHTNLRIRHALTRARRAAGAGEPSQLNRTAFELDWGVCAFCVDLVTCSRYLCNRPAEAVADPMWGVSVEPALAASRRGMGAEGGNR